MLVNYLLAGAVFTILELLYKHFGHFIKWNYLKFILMISRFIIPLTLLTMLSNPELGRRSFNSSFQDVFIIWLLTNLMLFILISPFYFFVKIKKTKKPEIEKLDNKKLILASTTKRFLNSIFDNWVFSLLVAVFLALPYSMGLMADGEVGLWIFLISIFQLPVGEYFFSKSFGKLITRTRVVSKDGSKPKLSQIVVRTLARFIPFDALSFLDRHPVGWHDSLSGTIVINSNDLKNKNTTSKQKNSSNDELLAKMFNSSSRKHKKNNLTKSNKGELSYKSVLILAGVLLIAGLFYWYEWRPKAIKKKCNEFARSKAIKKNFGKDYYDIQYLLCTREKGL